MAPAVYARLTRFALWALASIVVTGAAVRLTGSGLGCEDWPTCSEDRLVADLEYHAMVEFANRLFTGVVAAAVIAAVLGAWRRRPRRRDLTGLAVGLVAGVLVQVVLGALLVKTGLDPRFTLGHFLVSMVLLWNAALLDTRARSDTTPRSRGTNPGPIREAAAAHAATPRGTNPGPIPQAGAAHAATPRDTNPGPIHQADAAHAATPRGTTPLMLWAVLLVAAVLLVTGTLVTGAGPHAGDTRAARLPLLVREVARVHSVVAMVLLGLVLLAWRRLHAAGSEAHLRMGRVALLLTVQGLVGYTQYFSGVPALLVGAHVALASIIWIEIVKAVHSPAAAAMDPDSASPTAVGS